MDTFLTYAFLFFFGSSIGYLIEVLFRRFVSAKKWINPGFLHGPYIPLYGFGVCVLYLFSSLNYGIDNYYIKSILVICIIGIGVTLIELIAGLIFIKGMNIKLWDYSNRKGNYKGIICPLFSLIWAICGAIYYLFIHHYNEIMVTFFIKYEVYLEFFLGVFYGLMLYDFIDSTSLATKVSKIAKNSKIIISFEQFKLDRKNKLKANKNSILKEMENYFFNHKSKKD